MQRISWKTKNYPFWPNMHSLLKFHLICLKGVPIRSNTVKIKGATTYVYIYGMEHSSSGTNLHIFFLSGTYIIFHRRFVQHVVLF